MIHPSHPMSPPTDAATQGWPIRTRRVCTRCGADELVSPTVQNRDVRLERPCGAIPRPGLTVTAAMIRQNGFYGRGYVEPGEYSVTVGTDWPGAEAVLLLVDGGKPAVAYGAADQTYQGEDA